MRKHARRRGQSILEYLVIITVIVIAIFAIRNTVSGNMNSLFNSAAAKTANAAGSLSNVVPE